MITAKEIYRVQSENNVTKDTKREAKILFKDYVAQVRSYIHQNLPEDYSKGAWSPEKKTQYLENMISDFVNQNSLSVDGYVNAGVLDKTLLIQDVINDVTGEGILKEALEDPRVDEIQINDKNTIFVSKDGVLQRYEDVNGKPKQFTSNDEIHIVLNKLIDDNTGNIPQFTEGKPLLNAKTAKKQYRVNAVHYVANTRDKPPNNDPVTTIVIRKFKEVKLTLDDLIKSGAVSVKEAKLLSMIGAIEAKVFCVGPTGSGKTTLLNIICGSIPMDKRIIAIQNPTEISFMERDAYGRNTRNVCHWEVTPFCSLAELISNSLRATPDVLLIGESRDPEEFKEAQRAMQTGHKLLGTFHAEDAKDAIRRFGDEIAGGGSKIDAMRQVANSIDIIISQYKFESGARRVMEVTEIMGVDEKGEILTNPLFEFEYEDKVRINPITGKKETVGKHVQRNPISDKLLNKFMKSGFTRADLADFLTVNNDDVVSTDAND